MSIAPDDNMVFREVFVFRGIEHPMVDQAREHLLTAGSLELGRRLEPQEILMITRVLEPLWGVSTLTGDEKHLLSISRRLHYGFRSMVLPNLIGMNRFMKLRAWIGPRLCAEIRVPEHEFRTDVHARVYRGLCEHIALLIIAPRDIDRLDELTD